MKYIITYRKNNLILCKIKYDFNQYTVYFLHSFKVIIFSQFVSFNFSEISIYSDITSNHFDMWIFLLQKVLIKFEMYYAISVIKLFLILDYWRISWKSLIIFISTDITKKKSYLTYIHHVHYDLYFVKKMLSVFPKM